MTSPRFAHVAVRIALAACIALPACQAPTTKPAAAAQSEAAPQPEAAPHAKPGQESTPVPASAAAPAAILASRETLPLNGEWRFQPAAGPAAREPVAEAWGKMQVPGNWMDASRLTAGTGGAWQGWDPSSAPAAWYERTVTIPPAWAGRAVVLEIDRVSTDAAVLVDGAPVGEVRWPSGSVELTGRIVPGVPATVRLRVLAVDDRTEVTTYMGYVNEPKAKANLDNRGLIGTGVRLISRPAGAHITDVFVRPSTRRQRVDLDIEVAGSRGGEAMVEAEMLNEHGAVEKRFCAPVTIPASGGDPVTATVGFPWADPRLWDVGQPNRYMLRLSLAGAGLADRYEQPFGFREFWIDGKRFFLNGTEIRLRPNVLQYGAMPKKYLDEGYTFAELWPDDRGRRGSATYDDAAIAEADAVGLPIAGKAMHMADLVGDRAKWEGSGREEYRRLMELDVRRWRNSPAIVMWSHTANAFQWTGDGDPRLLGRHQVSGMQEYQAQRQRCLEAIGLIKAVDPTRPVFAHHGTDLGEVYTSNLYLNFIPLQEREEWFAAWADQGQMPWLGVEVGPPLYASMMRGRDGYTHQGHSEPHLSEWMAAELGPRAYALEPPDLAKIFTRFRAGDTQHEYEPHIRQDGFDRILTGSPSFVAFQNAWYKSTFRAWRTMGLTGGWVPWHQTDQALYPELAANNADTLAWIAGPAGATTYGSGPAAVTIPDFTRKDHAFPSGATLAKQVILINDGRAAAEASARWRVLVDDREIAADSYRGRIDPARTVALPITCTLPAGQTARTAGRIELEADIGGHVHHDGFAFSIQPPPARAAAGAPAALAVFDPRGDTTRLLQDLGYTTVPWTSGAPSAETAVIGAHALSDHADPPTGLAAWVRGGGRLLVCGQDPDWLRLALHLRTAPHVVRAAYPTIASHALFAGMPQADLADWTGSGSLIEAYPYAPGLEVLRSYGWHWGNRGSVSSAPIEKPHQGAWRPLLETGFDLAYTPLMELDVGRGRVTVCTLDLEGRDRSDPAATALAARLLTHVRTAPLHAKPATSAYLGGADGAGLLDRLGVIHECATAIATDGRLTIIGADATVDDAALRAALQAGARVLVLARQPGVGPLGSVVAASAESHGGRAVPAWDEAAGLSVSDLHWKTGHAARLLTSAPGMEVAADGFLGRVAVGSGVAIFTRLDPDWLPADELRYFRFTRWRQTRALCQVLGNLGASFRQDGAFLDLLEQPDHGWMLAGEWQVALTKPLPESPSRQWNPPQPISELARRLLLLDAPEHAFTRQPVPAYMENYQPASAWRWTDGECVFRTTVDVPARLAGRAYFLSVGRVDETEETFVNGTSVGASKQWLLARGHVVPAGVLRPGRNVIALRTWDEGIHGGMCGAPDQLFLRVLDGDPGFYHPDYVDDQVLPADSEAEWGAQHARWMVADNPYRYTRW